MSWPDCVEQAELVRSGEASARELVEAAIRRIEALDPASSAVVTRTFDAALEQAAAPRPGRLAGVPILIKDLVATVEGVRQTEGSVFLKECVASRDSEYVRRLRAGGLVLLGKASTSEFGNFSTVESSLYGICPNPWDRTRVPGGSSGGSAVAVATGMVGAAHGNDGGGSIRIPASCCGLVGLKPARGRNPLGPELGDVYGGLLAEHVLTRSVRDSAVLLDITSGPDSGDPYFAPPPEGTFESHAGRTPRRLRIGFSTEPPAGGRVDPACVEAVARTVRFCEELGHELEEASPDFDAAAMFDAFLELWSDGNAWMLERAIAKVGREPREDELEPLTRALAEAGRSRSAAAHLHTRRRLQELSRDVAAFFERYDLWLTPTLAEPPVPLGTFVTNEEDPMQTMERDGEFSPFTPVANVTGQPAISLPLGWTEGNLPIGVHFTARAGEEGTLIELAAQLEEAVGWRSRRPPAAEPAGMEAR